MIIMNFIRFAVGCRGLGFLPGVGSGWASAVGTGRLSHLCVEGRSEAVGTQHASCLDVARIQPTEDYLTQGRI